MAKILSFDVSSVSTGWALISNNKIKKYGVILIDKKLSMIRRLIIFKLGVVKTICECNPDIIVVEETYLKNVKTLKTLMQFIGVLNEVSYTIFGLIPIMLSPNTIRSKFELKTKEEAFNFINDRFKLNMVFDKDNDVTDACLQGLYYCQFLKENKYE